VIESLRIEGVKIVEEAELEFGPGLNVLTGETGAGKSIVLGALDLLVGGRASPDAVREGAESGCVEAVFRTEALPDLEAALHERGFAEPGSGDHEGEDQEGEGPEEPEHELVVHRTLSSKGRSRARVAGQLVPVSTLAELFSGRVEISSQHSSQALLRPESHGRFLDAAGGLDVERGVVAAHFAAVRALDAEIADLRSRAEERARRLDFLSFQLEEIDSVGLLPGELEELEAEHGRLAHAGRLREEGAAATAALSGDSERPDAASAADLVAAAERLVGGLRELDPSLGELAERLVGLDTELRDVASDLERYVDGIDTDPARLEAVEERLAQIERLRRKYGSSAEEILAFRDGVARELDGIEGADQREEELAASRAGSLEALSAAAAQLSKGRKKAAKVLSKAVQASLADLDMPEATFSVALEPAPAPPGMPCGAAGAEAPEFCFSANKGEPLRSLQKVASGGELSRVFLAVKNGLRRAGAGMVLVFDEVDAGIGGRAAERVGRALAELAEHHQVICITHLPQIAAFADVHFRVEKRERGGRTLAGVSRLEGEARVDEVARMAGGAKVSDATRRHARDLLRVKRSHK